MRDEGERLPGGYLNGAVRIGDTVRRTAGPWTPNVHALLDHLRRAGFNYAPRPLGIDDQGREVLEFVPGDTVGDAYPWPRWVWSESLLAEVGKAVAELHAAVADFRVPATAVWQFADGAPQDGEIVSHFDLAPYNVVVRDGRLAAFIDWDLARPLRAGDEVAFVAWEWVPLWHPDSARGLGWTSLLISSDDSTSSSSTMEPSVGQTSSTG
jgi:Ser/Thr protein kinase RdoA (MazF antagonist)